MSSPIPLPGVTSGLGGPPVYEPAPFSSSEIAPINTSQAACLQVSRLTVPRQFMIWACRLLQPPLCPSLAHHIPATPSSSRSSLSIPGACLQGLAYIQTSYPGRSYTPALGSHNSQLASGLSFDPFGGREAFSDFPLPQSRLNASAMFLLAPYASPTITSTALDCNFPVACLSIAIRR